MASRRWYNDGCSMAHALDLVGDRWALVVVRELLLGPKRFTDLRAGIPGVSPDVLAQRLRELEQSGVVRRDILPPPAASKIYELTQWGTELEPVVLALGRWGARSPAMRHDTTSSPDTIILGLKAMFVPERADDLTVHIGIGISDQRFYATVDDGRITVGRNWPTSPDATIHTPTTADTASIIWGDLTLDEAVTDGRATVTGDHQAAAQFVRLFPLPQTAPTGTG